jgi:hypothetical protein
VCIKNLVVSEIPRAILTKLAFYQLLIRLLFESLLQRQNLSLFDIRDVLPNVFAHFFVDL